MNFTRMPEGHGRLTADQHVAVKREIQDLPESAWAPYRAQDDLTTDREIAETVHTMNGTQEAFRLIVLRWPNPKPDRS